MATAARPFQIGNLVVTNEQVAKVPSQLQAVLVELLNYKIEDLVKEKELGTSLGFSGARELFAFVQNFAALLCTIDWNGITGTKAGSIASRAMTVRNVLQNIRSFSVQNYGNNAAGTRDSYIGELEREYINLFNEAAPVIAFQLVTHKDDDDGQKQIDLMLDQVKTAVKEQKKFAEEAKQTSENLRQSAQKVGITKYAVLFSEEASQHKKAAVGWLVATTVLGILAGAWGWVSYSHLADLAMKYSAITTVPSSQSTSQTVSLFTPGLAIQLSVARLIVFSVLLSAVFWAGKIYRAHRHNFVVNKHRQNALSTFEAFAAAARDDPQTKNAVLLQATQCIFAPQVTGYVTQDAEGELQPKILEVIRSAK